MVALLLAWLLPAVVYPPPAPGSIARHAERPDQPCEGCHALALTSDRATDRLSPGLPPLIGRPDLQFDHGRHRARGVDCTPCHAAGGVWPTKATCATCHAVEAPERCADCHPTAPDGRLRTAVVSGALRPARGMLDHRGDFAREHAAAARLEPASCEACHGPSDCQACHAGRIRPVDLHPADFIATHGPAARRDDPVCSTCHRAATFCVGCHAQSGLAQSAGPRSFGRDARDRQAFHPPGFGGQLGDVPGPAHHRYAARRSLTECVSCHLERDCVRCHGDQATTRLRATPHAPGFADDCRALLDANPRGCAKCHASTAELRGKCR
ncbi:MAG: hypothetical protein R3F43_19455 [bacterium]